MNTVVFIERPPSIGFAAVDLDLLRRNHDVIVVSYPGWPSPRFMVDLWRSAGRADVGYTFFASEHALAAAFVLWLRRRPFVAAVGGYDTANDKLHSYGLAATRRAWMPKLVARLATALVPHSRFALEELRALTPRGAAKASMAYLAIDVERWAAPGVERDVSLVVTVAKVTRESFLRKGIDRFVEMARQDEGRTYILAGQVEPSVLSGPLHDPPHNLSLVGPLDHDSLRALLWSAGTYVQLSWHETFGAAVAEAMACGCVPLISDQPALIEVTGGHGTVVPGGDPTAALGALAALDGQQPDRAAYRAHVASAFAPELRLGKLERVLQLSREPGSARRGPRSRRD